MTARLLQEKLLSGYAVQKNSAGTLSARVLAPKAMLARFYTTLSSACFFAALVLSTSHQPTLNPTPYTLSLAHLPINAGEKANISA